MIALSLGLLAFAVGLTVLERIFAQERDNARTALRDQREALAQYAGAALRDTLHRALETAAPLIDRARDDTLAPTDDILLVEGGEQIIPRTVRARLGDDLAARALYQSMLEGNILLERDDSPWSERLSLGLDVRGATYLGDRRAIETAFRALLAHRARSAVPAASDLPMTIGVLDFFVQHVKADPRLMAGILRDGFSESRVSAVEGLQSALLRARGEFTAGEFNFLAERVIALSESSLVPHADFEDRLREKPADRLDLGGETFPSVVNGWYLESSNDHSIRGVRVRLERMLAAIRREMIARGLIAQGDAVELTEGVPKRQLLARLQPVVASPSWDDQSRTIDERFWLKSGLVFVCGVLALSIVALALLEQSRRQRYLRLKSDFIATVSHELRTPLASLRLMTETIERRMEGVTGARDYPTRMLGDIDQLVFLIENILSFNRLDKGRWEPRLSDMVLADVLPAIKTEISSFGRAPVRLRSDGLDVPLRGDGEMLRLLFANLARNACLYNARDPVEIHVAASRTNGLRVQFTDNGVGIGAADREKILGEFYRAAPTVAGSRGSGLGLALCRKIMKLHGGSITVVSSSPEGTTFELVFP